MERSDILEDDNDVFHPVVKLRLGDFKFFDMLWLCLISDIVVEAKNTGRNSTTGFIY